MRYVDRFLSLSCSGDVMNACGLINKPSKEITESMGMIRLLKPIVLADPDKQFTVIDLCAGNALTSVLAVHLFKNVGALAVDIAVRKRHYDAVKKFRYVNANIFDASFTEMVKGPHGTDLIFIAVHPCKNLAKRVVELYLASAAKHLILMPCCRDNIACEYPALLKEKLGGYMLWSYHLAKIANGNFIQDKNVMSSCNAIVTAHKE